MRICHILIPLSASMLAACQPQTAISDGAGGGDGRSEPTTRPFDGISASDEVRFVGTEPFWGGEVIDGQALYSTPENPDGVRFPVTRFAGNNGLSFSGTADGSSFDLMITPGECSDGMSDRTYPFVATLTIGQEQRNGCAWTGERGFEGPENP